jgi:hypothetical protein
LSVCVLQAVAVVSLCVAGSGCCQFVCCRQWLLSVCVLQAVADVSLCVAGSGCCQYRCSVDSCLRNRRKRGEITVEI